MCRLSFEPDDSLHLDILWDANVRGPLPRAIEVRLGTMDIAFPFISSGIGALDTADSNG